MAKDPAVLFYTSDFLSGTSFFTDEQTGQYIKLLCQQHQLGMIPENHMVNLVGNLDSPVVKKFIRTDDGFYYNKRMQEEAEKRANFVQTRVDNGVKGGRPKNKENHKDNLVDNHMGNHMENENDNENKDVIKNEKPINRPGTKHFFTIPTVEEVRAYCVERKNKINAEAFIDFYTSKGWKVGNQHMKDWKAAVRTWEKRNSEPAHFNKTVPPAIKHETYVHPSEPSEEDRAKVAAMIHETAQKMSL